jgi:hypothetical protein
MAKIKLFDFLLTAAALTALFLLLPSDKEAKLVHKEQTNHPQLEPSTSGSPKTNHQQPITPSILYHA